jgi:glycosyltransferase involved in cell wall biosynthesis
VSLLSHTIRIGWRILSRQKKLSALVSALYAFSAYFLSLPGYNRLLRRHPPAQRRAPITTGVNIAGFLTMESGVGEAARSLVRVMGKTVVPTALFNLEDPLIRSRDKTYRGLFHDDMPYDINILCFNANQVPSLSRHLPSGWLGGKYSIGYWVWELDSFPKIWTPSFRCLDEIWTPSSFCTNAISKRSPLPVTTIPYAIDVTDVDSTRTKESFGLPEDNYTFLFIFSLQSAFERKNPLAVIRAFRKAFSGLGKGKVTLALKFSGSASHRWAYDEIVKASAGLPVTIIDSYLDASSLYRLMQLADCYVSLHRSEGFGLTIAESMFLGKPCIATGYSGNMEFMTTNTSYPVHYTMKKIEQSIGPYKKGEAWAEPDTNHAAELMRFVFEDPGKGQETGIRAAQHIRSKFSPEALSQLVEKRLKELK